MARGKKSDSETIYKIMLSVFRTGNYSETARQLKIPASTVKDIYEKNIEKAEFVKLREQKKSDFVQDATRIIDKATKLLEKRIDTALKSQDELDEIIEEVYKTDKKDLNETQKKAIVNKIAKMQLNNLSEVTTALGTLYDKRNLEAGKSTSNTELRIKMSNEVEELSQ